MTIAMPKGRILREALELLEEAGYPVEEGRLSPAS